MVMRSHQRWRLSAHMCVRLSVVGLSPLLDFKRNRKRF